MNEAQFVVDTALLTELGERMIGRAYIALAELVKNSYDADALDCRIEFSAGKITIRDDGHGMSENEFLEHWMRIGTTHKAQQPTSRTLGRSMTGSKGFGRLSAQFLADEMTLESTSVDTPSKTLYAVVDWSIIQHAHDLDTFNVLWDSRSYVPSYPNGSKTGTSLTLSRLRSEWDSLAIEALGNELAVLRSPFRRSNRRTFGRSAQDFYVDLVAPQIGNSKASFDAWQEALLANWKARIRGSLNDGRSARKADVIVEFKAGYPDTSESANTFHETIEFPVKAHAKPVPAVDSAQFEILIFKPERRQPGPLKVREMREYLRQFGNVSVYDAGFRLPYYGSLEDKTGQDWLNIALDQGRRLTVSELLPDRLKVAARYLLDLPAPGRILGAVDINTNRERDVAVRASAMPGECLVLQPGRDRLAPNIAFEQLRELVRFALDLYANRFALIMYQCAERNRAKESPPQALGRAIIALDRNREMIPTSVYSEIRQEVSAARDVAITQEQALDRRAVLLAPLATAGVVALALNHELARESRFLEWTGARLQNIAKEHGLPALDAIATDFDDVHRRLHSLRELFAPLLSDVDDAATDRLKVRSIVRHVVGAMSPLMGGVQFEVADISEDLRFPVGSFAEWSAVLQNVLSNAWNALLDSGHALIVFCGGRDGRTNEWLRVNDTGVGLNVRLDESPKLFEPFERRLEISDENRSVAMGGQGLGLTIVRMIARHRSARVGFVRPQPGFSTTFEISWRGA